MISRLRALETAATELPNRYLTCGESPKREVGRKRFDFASLKLE
jgi:hypothetical protein